MMPSQLPGPPYLPFLASLHPASIFHDSLCPQAGKLLFFYVFYFTVSPFFAPKQVKYLVLQMSLPRADTVQGNLYYGETLFYLPTALQQDQKNAVPCRYQCHCGEQAQ